MSEQPACGDCGQPAIETIQDGSQAPILVCRTHFVKRGGNAPGLFGPLRPREPLPIERDCSFCQAPVGKPCHGAMPNEDGSFNDLPYFHSARRTIRKGIFD